MPVNAYPPVPVAPFDLESLGLPVGFLADLSEDEQIALLDSLTEEEAEVARYAWPLWARPNQLPPSGDWRTWLIMTGRGWGKNRTASEYIIKRQAEGYGRFTLIGATAADCRDYMVQGESGLIESAPPWNKPVYEPSKRQLTWPNGATAKMYSAEQPERLRGYQCDTAWCLSGNTRVLMADGTNKLITNVQPGDTVITTRGLKRVLAQALTQKDATVYKVQAGSHTITGTFDHPVWVVSIGFVPLGNVEPGDLLVVGRSSREATHLAVKQVAVNSVTKLTKSADVYNITVEDANEFFANGILVHNCDELASWVFGGAFTQLAFTMRLGTDPRVVVTTTPRPIELLEKILTNPHTVFTNGTTYENAQNLAPSFLDTVVGEYAGTRLGEQELLGQILHDTEGALWKREMLSPKVKIDPATLKRIIVAVDPSVADNTDANTRRKGGALDDTSKTDACGIIVCGVGLTGHAYILADYTIHGSPAVWGEQVIQAFDFFNADAIVAEANNGGALITSLLRGIRKNVNVKLVHASRGKMTRAEPVSNLYERKLVHHVEEFKLLEDELCNWVPGNKSPNRLDALVWGVTELLLEPLGKRKIPSVLVQATAKGWSPALPRTNPMPQVKRRLPGGGMPGLLRGR